MTTFLDIDWEYMYAELELESKELLKKNKQLKDENERLKLENEMLKFQIEKNSQQQIMPQPWTQPPVSPWTQPPVSPWTQPKSPYGEPYVFPGVYYKNGN